MSTPRLSSLIRSSPFWCSNSDLSSPSSGYSLEAEALDPTWYFRETYKSLSGFPSIKELTEDYLANVARSRRSPNMIFDESWYRSEYRDVDELVSNGHLHSGWAHYLSQGAERFYNPNAWFDEKWYQRRYPEVAVSISTGIVCCGFEHFLQYGIYKDFSLSIYFNTVWYRRQYMTENSTRFPIVHYLLANAVNRPCPTPLFHPEWYSNQYLKASGEAGSTLNSSQLEHYLFFGRQLGYSPSPYFNEQTYRRSYPEVVESIRIGIYKSGLEHYINEGAEQGYIATSHLGTGAADYNGPTLMKAYEKSLLLNVRQIAQIRQLLNGL